MSADLRTMVKRAYRSTDLYRLRQLLAEESRWQRKQTIARNKLIDVRRRVNKLAGELAQARLDKPEEFKPELP